MIFDLVVGEMFIVVVGYGVYLNGKLIWIFFSDSLFNGLVGVGFNGCMVVMDVVNVVGVLVLKGGVFFCNVFGGFMLVYIVVGWLIGYIEFYMNVWDCLVGFLIICEVGGDVMY